MNAPRKRRRTQHVPHALFTIPDAVCDLSDRKVFFMSGLSMGQCVKRTRSIARQAQVRDRNKNLSHVLKIFLLDLPLSLHII